MRRAKGWKPVRMQYWMGYCLIALLITGIVTGLLYARTLSMIEEQHRTNAQNMLKSQKLLFERCLQEMEQIAIQIDGDPDMSKLRLSTPGYDTYAGYVQLQRYVAANTLFHEIALLTPEGDVLSSLGSYPMDRFIGRYQSEALALYMQGFARQQAQVCLLPLTNTDHLLVMYPLPSFGKNKTRVLLFAMAKAQVDALFASSMQGDDSNFAIYSAEDGLVLYEYRKRRGVEWAGVASEEVSTRLALRYVYQLDDTDTVQSLQLLNQRFAYVLALALLFSIVMGWALSRWSYRPIRRLLLLVGGDKEGGNELGYVADSIKGILHANMDMARQLTSYSSIAQEYVLQRLLCGRSEGEQWSQLFEAAHIEFPHPYYSLLYLDAPALEGDTGGRFPAQLRAEMIRHLAEAAGAFGVAYGLEWMNASFVLLINHPNKALNLQTVYRQLQAAFGERFRAQLRGGGGMPVDQLSEIQVSLYRAMTSADYARFSGQAFAGEQEHAQVRIAGQRVRMPQEEALVQAIRTGDVAGTQRALDAAWTALSGKTWSVPTLRAQTISLISTLFRSVETMHLDEYYLQVMHLLEQPTLEAYFQALREFCGRVCESVQAQLAAQSDALLMRIMRYLEEHYTQVELSVREVAEALVISPSYLVHYMQERVQTTPAKYIESLRMERARTLLRETQLPVKDIVQQIGYRDNSSFVRKFREKEGLTPMQYRTLHQRQEGS